MGWLVGWLASRLVSGLASRLVGGVAGGLGWVAGGSICWSLVGYWLRVEALTSDYPSFGTTLTSTCHFLSILSLEVPT